MKKIIINISILVVIGGLLTSCGKDFLSWPMGTSLDESTALETPKDVQNSVVGMYGAFDGAAFWGRNALAIGDIQADMCGFNKGQNNNHFNSIEQFQYTDASGEFSDLWAAGYQVIDRAARSIKAGKRILGEGVNEADTKKIHAALSQAYGMKAFAHFFLVNLFGLPYTAQPNSLGIIIIGDEPVTTATPVTRGTVTATYAQVLSDIAAAKAHFAQGDGAYPSAQKKFYMNEGAIFALEARVKLFMGEFPAAATAAALAMSKASASIQSDTTAYVGQWGTSAPTAEDIFSCNITSTTSLSANSINSLYASYGGANYPKLLNLYGPRDIRLKLFKTKELADSKYGLKYPNANAVNNNPVFRASEMQLIIAEAKAQGNDIPGAQAALLTVASRNLDIRTVADLPATKEALLSFIADERCRELFQEGHRLFDLRRRHDLMSRVPGQTLRDVTNLDMSKFVYPIPQSEINASKIAQNNWTACMP